MGGGLTGGVRQRHLPLLAGGLVLAAWCGWVSGFHRSSAAAEITWVVSLATVVAVGVAYWRGRSDARFAWHLEPATDPWPRPGRGGGRLALLGVAPWLVVIVLAAAWDALGIDTGPHEYHLTISALSAAFRLLDALLLLVWMLVGIGYAAAAPAGRWIAPVVRGRTNRHQGAAAPSLGLGWRTRRRRHRLPGIRSGRRCCCRRTAPWGSSSGSGSCVVAVFVDLFARRSAGRLATAEEFARFISTSRVANVVLIAAWAFAGYHLFAR